MERAKKRKAWREAEFSQELERPLVAAPPFSGEPVVDDRLMVDGWCRQGICSNGSKVCFSGWVDVGMGHGCLNGGGDVVISSLT